MPPKKPSLLEEMMESTQPKGRGCAVCKCLPPLTKDAVGLIEAARPAGRGAVVVRRFLVSKNLWPEAWSHTRIAAHWEHVKQP